MHWDATESIRNTRHATESIRNTQHTTKLRGNAPPVNCLSHSALIVYVTEIFYGVFICLDVTE